MNVLPETSDIKAVSTDWFPAPWQAVLWRGWGVVPVDRLARVLGTTEKILRAEADRLGLDGRLEANPVWLTRGYLTIIRACWHLCTYDQIMALLDIDAQRLAFLLKEDDFLWHKLGKLKPAVPDNRYAPLSAEQEKATAAIRARILRIAPALRKENAFGFVERFSQTPQVLGAFEPSDRLSTVYSYFALYGDPLMEPELDPFPDALLAQYAKMGVHGVWLQGILYQLIEFPFDSSKSVGRETRLANLNKLIARAAQYGIGVYLYLNEPRSMEDAFFERYPHLRGSREDQYYAMCTSQPEVQRYLEEGMEALFAQAKGLAGFFTISMSENLTNCWSRAAGAPTCPRCAKRAPWDIVAEVNNLMARGAHRADPNAKAIAWSWGWGDDWAEKVPPLLTQGQIVQAVSEERLETNVGGVKGYVSDYSISQPGPGEKAKRVWKAALDSGLEACAKVQLNNSWEMSAVPYLPVFDKVAAHIGNLKRVGVRHLQMSWTLGGYPSPVLKMANELMAGDKTVADFLKSWLGEALGVIADEAQRLMSAAFGEFPFDVRTLYTAPQNYGPMTPFYSEKTSWKATMIGFPYDDIDSWRAKYDAQVLETQFAKLVAGWAHGVGRLEAGRNQCEDFDELYRMAAAALCHFESTLNHIRFMRGRDGWLERRDASARSQACAAIQAEKANVERMLALRHEDDRMGFEASNHYYYTVNDLLEKLINLDACESKLDG